MAVLMLRDTPVYDIAKNIVLNNQLSPFASTDDTKKAYEKWRRHRAYLKSNRTAERVIAQAGGNDTHEAKRRLSLSDGYWVKYKYDNDILFESITPYMNPFSVLYTQKGAARSSSVPEIVIGGSQPKQWKRGDDGVIYMQKTEHPEQVHAEMLAVKLAQKCGIPVMDAFVETENGGRIYATEYTSQLPYGVINLVNMTSTDVSLIPLDQLGVWVNGYDPVSVAGGYVSCGVTECPKDIAVMQVVFDCIVGNIDRETNNSNWAIFMDNHTGNRTPSAMYDFNWANMKSINEININKIAPFIKKAKLESIAITQITRICAMCDDMKLDTWASNAKMLLSVLS